MSASSALAKHFDPLRTDEGRIATKWWWVGGVGLGLALVAIFGGVFWSIVTAIGLLGCIAGAIAIAHGSAKFFRLGSRSSGQAVLVAGVIVLLIGTAANAATHPTSATTTGVPPAASGSVRLEHKTTPSPTPTRVETEAEVKEVAEIPFELTSVDDSTSDVGTTVVTTTGQNGEVTMIYLAKYVDGVEISRTLSREVVTLLPIAQVTSVGSRQPAPPPPPPAAQSDCNSNYADVCVPIASDVDCAGGSGNGPAYVDGPLRVVGTDEYDLDRDGDGIACDK
ncbi:G5 domain-containing protein [Cryobacterium fucosi]|uniref:G5 domain-containing protein n=1 Tax=Cryobacterium fucosi TaxID=1259157 RepID=A0A4R9AUP9_9MICO|nr:G5 domain-containing protein [Cryobacterium fucosi]TFD70522.1 hypothetical protein E3T48_16335 [Cryobacterium fucosi]